MLKDPKNISLLIIPYLTICGALYHIAYWNTFGLNGFLYVSLSDIIKSVVQPVVSPFLLSIIGIFLFYYIIRADKVLPIGGGRETKMGRVLNSNIGIYIIMIIWAAIVATGYLIDINPYRWPFLASISVLPFWIYFQNTQVLENEIKDVKVRSLVIYCLVYLPFFSFAMGKRDSQVIYKNLEYKFVTNASLKTINRPVLDTLKLIGISSESVFLSTLNNATVFIINKKIDTLVLQEKK